MNLKFVILILLFNAIRPMNEEDNPQLEELHKKPILVCVSQQTDSDCDLKSQLAQWAIQELIEKQQHERKERISQQKQKWIIAGIGVVTTTVPLVITIVKATQ